MSSSQTKWISEIDGLSYEQLRIEFMRMSPTYQFMAKWSDAPTSIAREFSKAIEKNLTLSIKRGFFSKGTEKLKTIQLRQLESIFEGVEYAYEDYGDINKPYEQWWAERGHLIFDTPSNKPIVRDLGTVNVGDFSRSIKRINESMKSLTKGMDSRLHIVLSVPMNLTHKDAIAQVSDLLKGNLFSLKNQPRVRK